jgi:hypothetical protein
LSSPGDKYLKKKLNETSLFCIDAYMSCIHYRPWKSINSLPWQVPCWI